MAKCRPAAFPNKSKSLVETEVPENFYSKTAFSACSGIPWFKIPLLIPAPAFIR